MSSQTILTGGSLMSKVTLVSFIVLGASTRHGLVAARIPIAPYTAVYNPTLNPWPLPPVTLAPPSAGTTRTTPALTTSRPKTTSKGVTTASTTGRTGSTTTNSSARPGDGSTTPTTTTTTITTTTQLTTTPVPWEKMLFETVAIMCEWLKKNTWYGCDGPVEQWLWKLYLGLRYGVYDCNSLCVNYHGKHSGHCTDQANYDSSSWCPKGQTCICE